MYSDTHYTTLNLSIQVKIPSGSTITNQGNSITLPDGTELTLDSIIFSDEDCKNRTALELEDIESVQLEQFPF